MTRHAAITIYRAERTRWLGAQRAMGYEVTGADFEAACRADAAGRLQPVELTPAGWATVATDLANEATDRVDDLRSDPF